MVVLLKKNPDKSQLDSLTQWLRNMGVEAHISVGAHQTIVGLVGDTSKVDINVIRALDIVEDVKRIQEPFKNANRKFHPEDTVIEAGILSLSERAITGAAHPGEGKFLRLRRRSREALPWLCSSTGPVPSQKNSA